MLYYRIAKECIYELPTDSFFLLLKIVEDSIAGIKAAQNAGVDVIAFLGSEMYQNNDYLSEVKKCGVDNIFFDMRDVKHFLFDN